MGDVRIVLVGCKTKQNTLFLHLKLYRVSGTYVTKQTITVGS